VSTNAWHDEPRRSVLSMQTTCHRCGMDEDGNDGPLHECPQCGETLCDQCCGDTYFDRCESCRQGERDKRWGRARVAGKGVTA
jgi:predicted RNA-binding Zn-ribbon protein involved in translation (DUF1610 family)